MINTYDSYVKESGAITIEQMRKMHENMMLEIGEDEDALELLECFFVKTAEWTQLYDYNSASVQVAFPITQNLLIGGQTKEGTDACNEVTMRPKNRLD